MLHLAHCSPSASLLRKIPNRKTEIKPRTLCVVGKLSLCNYETFACPHCEQKRSLGCCSVVESEGHLEWGTNEVFSRCLFFFFFWFLLGKDIYSLIKKLRRASNQKHGITCWRLQLPSLLCSSSHALLLLFLLLFFVFLQKPSILPGKA